MQRKFSKIPAKVGDYVTLPIALPPLPACPFEAVHYLYVAPDEPKIPTPSSARSLFLSNIPVDTTDWHLKALFSTQLGLPAGRVEFVRFPQQQASASDTSNAPNLTEPTAISRKRKRNGPRTLGEVHHAPALPSTWDRALHAPGSTAIVAFVDRSSMEVAMKATKRVLSSNKFPVWGQGIEDKLPPLGVARYRRHQELTYPDKSAILDSVNKHMIAYAAQEDQQARLRAQQRQEPDEDGFVTVTRGGRNKPASQAIGQLSAETQKKKHKGFDDFYRFQGREKRKEKAKELLRKFEEDKEKIRLLKQGKTLKVQNDIQQRTMAQ